MHSQPLDYVVVLDFEATCDDKNPPVPQEIIEFPSILVNMKTLEPEDEFSTFVRPVHHPILTDFCKELTSITQEQVDAAPTFPEVFEHYLTWLRSHGLPVTPEEEGPSYAILLCGDWDFRIMLPAQLEACKPAFDYIPHPFRQWINVKRIFERWYGKRKVPGMLGMLRALDLKLTGRHHRGIDDCRNITKLVQALATRGLPFDITSELSVRRYPPVDLSITFNGDTQALTLGKRTMSSLLGSTSSLFRREVVQVQFPDGTEVTEADLPDFRNGTSLHAFGKE